jgi:hypothetical protein
VNFLEALGLCCFCFFLRFVFFMLITAVYERHTIITEPLLPGEARLARGENHRWTIRLTDRAVGELLDAGILSADLTQVEAEYKWRHISQIAVVNPHVATHPH